MYDWLNRHPVYGVLAIATLFLFGSLVLFGGNEPTTTSPQQQVQDRNPCHTPCVTPTPAPTVTWTTIELPSSPWEDWDDSDDPNVCLFNEEVTALKEGAEPWHCRIVVPGQAMSIDQIKVGLKFTVVGEYAAIVGDTVFTVTVGPHKFKNSETLIEANDGEHPWPTLFTLENLDVIAQPDGLWRNSSRMIIKP